MGSSRSAIAVAAGVGASALIVAATWVATAPAAGARAATAPCATTGYFYDGVATTRFVRGIAATVEATRLPTVRSGHVAAWVGVGGVHEGPAGANSWLQTGLVALPHGSLRLYVEYVFPRHSRRFLDLGPAYVGRTYLIAVAEVRSGRWRASVDGVTAGPPVRVPSAEGGWRGVATAETWTAGRAACNHSSYSLGFVSERDDRGHWRAANDASPIAGGVG